MSQSSRRSSVVVRLMGEALAIFVGVGAALGGQAWFEARTDRVEEREYLEAVLAEVEAVQALADTLNVFLDRQRSLAIQVAGLLAQPPNRIQADSLALLAPMLSTYATFQVHRRAEDLFASEALAVVKDASVRSALADFRGDLLVLGSYLTQNREFVLSDYRRFGMEYLDLRDRFWRFEPETPPASRHHRDGARLAESPEFENIIDMLIIQYRNGRSGLDLLRDGMVSAREAAEGRLADLSRGWTNR